MDDLITAIDLGTTKVVCLAGKRTPNGYEVIAACEAPSQGVLRGEVINNQSVISSIKPLLEQLEEATGRPAQDVVVGIAGQHIHCKSVSSQVNRKNKLEAITEEEVEKMQADMYESRVEPGEQVLHVVPQSYHVDDYKSLQNPVGMDGGFVEGNYRLFIGKAASAQQTKRCIESAGLKLSQLVLEPLASAKAVLHEDERELGVAMVDIGGGTTDLLVIQDHVIRHTAVIPFGGNIITEDIRQCCEVTFRQAEQMKIQYGSCFADLAPENKAIIIPGIGGREKREIPFKFLSQVIQARMEEIMDAILYEIAQSGYANRLPAGIVFTGGGAKLAELSTLTKFMSGYQTRIARPINANLDRCTDANSVTYACAVGLLMMECERMLSAPQEEPVSVETENVLFPGTEASPKTKGAKGTSGKKQKVGKKPGGRNIFTDLGKYFTSSDNEA